MSVKSNLGLFLSANTAEFERSLRGAQRQFNDFGKSMQKLGTAMSIGITAPLTAIGYKSVRAFNDSAKAIAQVEAGIKSTGGAAGFTSDELQKMAESLQGRTIFDDDTILKDVTANLLTFTNVAQEQFAKAQQAVLDLSTRMGTDLSSATIQVGKALNDPIKGMKSLAKAGIQFSDAQKEQITAMQEANNLAGAQAIILQELDRQFGGSAEAAVTGAGAIEQLNNELGDSMETIGKLIVDAVQPLVRLVRDLNKSFQSLDPQTQKMVVGLAGIATATGPVLLGLGTLTRNIIPSMKTGAKALASPILAWAAALGAVALVIKNVVSNWNPMANMQERMLSMQAQINTSVMQERASMDTLLAIARDETRSKVERAGAIKKLNELSPEYLGNLTQENINTQEATTAIDNYVIALEKKIKLRAAEERLVEIEKAINEEIRKGVELIENEGTMAVTGFAGAWDFVTNAIAQNSMTSSKASENVEALRKEQEILKGVMLDNTDVMGDATAGLGHLGDGYAAATKAIGEYKGALISASQKSGAPQISSGIASGNQVANSDGAVVDQFAPVQGESPFNMGALSEAVKSHQEEVQALQQTYMTLGETIGASFAQALSSTESSLQAMSRALMNFVREAIKAFLGQAIAGAIAAAFNPPTAASLILAGAAPAAVMALFDSFVPKLAQGGLTMGPTLAMIGDNPSGMEAVIPFEKMGQFMNQFSGKQDVNISGVLTARGSDLQLVLDNNNYGKRKTL